MPPAFKLSGKKQADTFQRIVKRNKSFGQAKDVGVVVLPG
jgi:hypothetical protein